MSRISTARATAWCLIALTIFLVVLEAWSRHTAYRSLLAQNSIAVENVAQAAEEHVEGAMNTVSWLLDGIVERVETDGIEPGEQGRLQDYLTTRLNKKNSALQGLFVHDARGALLVATDAHWARGVTAAGRAYFDHHRLRADRELHIGPPIVSRITGEWVITLSRRWNDREGRFAGIVLATIPVRYFEQYYDRFSVGKQGSLMLALADGTVVAGRPAGKGLIGTSAAGTPFFAFAQRSGPRGTAMLKAHFDQTERLMSYRRVEDYPLMVVAALAKEEILASWWEVTRRECAAIGVMLAMVCVLGGWLVSHIRLKQRLQHQLQLAQADLQAKNATLDRLARTDALTGLDNRRHFDERMAAETARAAREGTCVSLVLVDIDFFKRYNDMHGHTAGDDCLRIVAAALGSAAHRPADMAARYGGEEFAILLPGTDGDGALQVAESARAAVRSLALPHEANTAGIVTISAGVASFFPDDADEARALIEAADGALYRAKEAGRNRVEAASTRPGGATPACRRPG
ncbi:diguanylate cyclase [Massilia dura]|uniref:diguanylate cyclase n=1 Tax=Pseudoduganella dura TaxID=321982 RepID=A0A6I3XW35_9BURK|nr:sensor domain-containing diguanylate cyclase [Pseudoduganella dura]MUI15955.1 diguanylate cyclase [Pseudoduganella dura]